MSAHPTLSTGCTVFIPKVKGMIFLSMYMYITTGLIFRKTDGVLATEGQLPAGSHPSVTLTLILFLNINLYVMYMYD